MEKTKYVIAKDGMVISIEGNDEAKVKEIVKDVESKLGVSKVPLNAFQISPSGRWAIIVMFPFLQDE